MMMKTATIDEAEPVMTDFDNTDVLPDGVVIASDPDQVKASPHNHNHELLETFGPCLTL
jgi:hypothetical protein